MGKSELPKGEWRQKMDPECRPFLSCSFPSLSEGRKRKTLFSLHGATVLAALTYPEEPWMKQHISWESCDRVRRNGTFCPCWCGRFLNVYPWVCLCVPTWGSHLSRDPVLLINLAVLDNFENMLMMSKVIVKICLKSQQRYIKCTTSFGLI